MKFPLDGFKLTALFLSKSCRTILTNSQAAMLCSLKVSFIASQTRESCSKTGKHLLGTISCSHPFVISALLDGVSDTLETIGKVL